MTPSLTPPADPKPRVRIHADSQFFSGAERLIAVLAGDDDLRSEFDLSLQYRGNDRFAQDIESRLPTSVPAISLPVHQVAAWVSSKPPALRPLAKAWAHGTGLKYRFMRRDLPVLAAEYGRARPDVVHIQDGGYPGAHSCLAAAVAAKSSGIPVVFMVNNLAQGYGERYRAFDRAWDQRVIASVDLWVTGSAAASGRLQSVLALPAESVRVVPNGLDAPVPRLDRDPALRGIGADPARLVVAVVAHLEPRKGQSHLVRALARIRDAGGIIPQVILEGEGPDRAKLAALVRALRLEADVVMPGRIDHIADLMAAADVIALPSVAREDFPNVVLEAMALRRPVLASRLAGIPDQVVDGVTGLLVAPGDEAGLAEALDRLASDADMRTRMGEAGCARHALLFTARAAASRWADVYRDLLAVTRSR